MTRLLAAFLRENRCNRSIGWVHSTPSAPLEPLESTHLGKTGLQEEGDGRSVRFGPGIPAGAGMDVFHVVADAPSVHTTVRGPLPPTPDPCIVATASLSEK